MHHDNLAVVVVDVLDNLVAVVVDNLVAAADNLVAAAGADNLVAAVAGADRPKTRQDDGLTSPGEGFAAVASPQKESDLYQDRRDLAILGTAR